MAQRQSTTVPLAKVSEPPLDGLITGLHLVQNSRTKESFILGGADDGSIAFWALEYARQLFFRHATPSTVTTAHSSYVHAGLNS
jgi:hypothetical protein